MASNISRCPQCGHETLVTKTLSDGLGPFGEDIEITISGQPMDGLPTVIAQLCAECGYLRTYERLLPNHLD